MSDWRPCASIDLLRDRAEALAAIRHFFSERQVLEVDTPALASAANPDASIDSITATAGPHTGPLFLQTSPEFAMKKLLAAGETRIFAFAPVWRNGERGALHAPEFTMLEWYRTGFDMFDLIDEVEALMSLLIPAIGTPATRISYHALFEQTTGVDLGSASREEIRALAGTLGIVVPAHHPDDGLVEMIFNIATASWMKQQPAVIVHHFPASQA